MNSASSQDDKSFIQMLAGDSPKQNTQIYRVGGKIHQKLLFENIVADTGLTKRLAQALCRTAYEKGSSDNISVAVSITNFMM